MEYKVELTFTEQILGSAPSDKEVYTTYIAAKKAELAEEEVALLPEDIDNKGLTVFRRNDKNEVIYLDYQIKGFLKEAARAVTGTKAGVTALYSKINLWLFIAPRIIPVTLRGKTITEVKEKEMRPLRAMTMQGPRVSLAASEMLPAGTMLDFSIKILPLGEKELNEKMILSWLDYGQYGGISQWHSGSYGRFKYKIK